MKSIISMIIRWSLETEVCCCCCSSDCLQNCSNPQREHNNCTDATRCANWSGVIVVVIVGFNGGAVFVDDLNDDEVKRRSVAYCLDPLNRPLMAEVRIVVVGVSPTRFRGIIHWWTHADVCPKERHRFIENIFNWYNNIVMNIYWTSSLMTATSIKTM